MGRFALSDRSLHCVATVSSGQGIKANAACQELLTTNRLVLDVPTPYHYGMRTVKATIRAVSIWAMIPLTVLSGTPLIACICANGDVKLLCQRCASLSAVTEESHGSCCFQAGQLEETAPTCCQEPAKVAKQSNELAASSRCCHSVVQLPIPGVTAKSIAPPDEHVASVPLFVALPKLANAFPSHLAKWHAQEVFPAPDFVVLHHAFLI